jgi:hypothetical protein
VQKKGGESQGLPLFSLTLGKIIGFALDKKPEKWYILIPLCLKKYTFLKQA